MRSATRGAMNQVVPTPAMTDRARRAPTISGDARANAEHGIAKARPRRRRSFRTRLRGGIPVLAAVLAVATVGGFAFRQSGQEQRDAERRRSVESAEMLRQAAALSGSM